MDDFTQIADIASNFTVNAVLFYAWWLERKRAHRERERVEEQQKVILRLFESMLYQNRQAPYQDQ